MFSEHGDCIGIAFQSYAGSDAENIGYVIPTPVIEHFLTDYERNGGFTGFPSIGIQWQKVESEALRRLAKMEGPCQVQGGELADAQPIVPARAMQLVERSLGGADTPVHVAVRSGEILVRTGGTTISARLVDGRFPRWRDVFPERPDAIRVQAMAGPLLAAVRQAAIVTSEQSKGVDFSFEPGQLVLSGRSAESGESRVELPIDHAGEAVRIKLDPRFVSDFLRVLDGGSTISIEIADPQSACVCRTDDGYGYVIMPLAAD